MASAQTPADTIADQSLHEVTVKARRPGVTNLDGALNGHNISRAELFKAACCNLGESFSTNPSVDVSYNDAATGARQIKLLGLAGTYVQMLTEQLPNFRGAATPYALGYVPGPWMKSIQVSKGSASVKNGYESITGQINVEYLKPEDEQAVEVNLFGDSKSRIEANAAANLHVGERASGNLMLTTRTASTTTTRTTTGSTTSRAWSSTTRSRDGSGRATATSSTEGCRG